MTHPSLDQSPTRSLGKRLSYRKKDNMNNQHAGLSQALADQRIAERRQQATLARLGRGTRPPNHRRRSKAPRWLAAPRWPAVAGEQPPAAHTASADRLEATMSKLARALVLGATLAAMHLAGLTAVAQAQANDLDGKDARRPPSERQVGESWRHSQVATPEQTAADAALRRQLARERFSIPSQTPDQPTAPAPPEPSGQPSWLVASLGGFAAGVVLAGGLAVLVARRAGRRARVGHAT